MNWDRETYYRLAEQGYFQGRRVQLIEGEIVEMSPQKHPHAATIGLLHQMLSSLFGKDWWIREQLPLKLADNSEPEPDISVVPGSPRDYSDHPTTATLLVEVADRSLSFDKNRKLKLYASANIPEYWIVDLRKRRVLVFRQPVPGSRTYEESFVRGDEESLETLAFPQTPIRVADILP